METAEKFVKNSKIKLCLARNIELLLPHSVPRLNLHAAGNSDAAYDVLEELLATVPSKCPSYITTYPIPIAPPANDDGSVVKGCDPVLKTIKNKQSLRAVFDKMKRTKKFKNISSEEIDDLYEKAKTEPEVTLHPSILELAQVGASDPRPNFTCDYNQYYGNNVAICEQQGRIVIVHSEQHAPSKLRVVFPGFDEGSDYVVSHVTHRMKNGTTYQVDGFSDLVLLRQKKSCGLFKFNLDTGARLEKIGIVTTPDVFVNCCINTFRQDEFATVSPNSAIEIHDVLGKTKRSVEVEGVKDNWGHAHYHDQNVLMYTDRDSVSLCDLRESGSESLQWEFKSQTEMCDDAFAAAKGKVLHYVCTKHYLMSLDIRKGFHQRWSHGLPNAPSLLNVVAKENQNDALLIGCQSSGGVVYVQSSPFGDFSSDILVPPLRLPSFRETLHLARMKEYLLSPITASRFSLSLTGLTSFKHSDKVHIFSCNSVGDLFVQYISPASRETVFEPLGVSDLERLADWESQCVEQFRGVDHGFEATNIISPSNIADFFEPGAELTHQPSEPSVTNTAQPWNKSKKFLKSFQDVLAPKILAHWDVEEDDEWGDVHQGETAIEGEISEDSSDDQDVDTKVRAWLEKSVSKAGTGSDLW